MNGVDTDGTAHRLEKTSGKVDAFGLSVEEADGFLAVGESDLPFAVFSMGRDVIDSRLSFVEFFNPLLLFALLTWIIRIIFPLFFRRLVFRIGFFGLRFSIFFVKALGGIVIVIDDVDLGFFWSLL